MNRIYNTPRISLLVPITRPVGYGHQLGPRGQGRDRLVDTCHNVFPIAEKRQPRARMDIPGCERARNEYL